MISEKFVRIAREIINHCRKGKKLRRGGLISSNSTTCPLGVVCLCKNKNINVDYPGKMSDNLYDFAHNVTDTDSDFEEGFDDSAFSEDEKNYNTENYIIGWALGKQCDKRNWII